MNKQNPKIFVVFGATGDLAQKKIMPSLLSLYAQKVLPEDSHVIAFSRRPWNDGGYRNFIKPFLSDKKVPEEILNEFLGNILYVEGTFDAIDSYSRLKDKILERDKTLETPSEKLFHLAIQPEFYESVFKGLGETRMNISLSGETVLPKIIIEKPFGQDIYSAENLQKVLSELFSEDQIYRIDHYLAKPGVQELIDRRRNDTAFELKLNRDNVALVSIKLLESIDIQGRGEFYETNGALRDIGQNHALQMLAITAMSLPMSEDNMPQARTAILKNIKRIEISDLESKVRRAQYEGYTAEQDVAPNSKIETYFKISIDLLEDRWSGVPFEIEGGKAFNRKRAEISITFKDDSVEVFNLEGSPQRQMIRDAYEVLIEQAILGKKAWFVSIDEVLASWRFVTPILENIQKIQLPLYPKGTDTI